MTKFYNFVDRGESVDLYISGDIVRNDDKEWYEAWGFECTSAKSFKEDLSKCDGKPVNIYIDSYGGDVQVASSIYSALKEYPAKKTVKIASIAASAASVIAMAGDTILMAKTALIVIHDPLTYAEGNVSDFTQVIESLNVVKESILNAYTSKSNLSREKIAELMTAETWLNYNTALEYGFIDGEIGKEDELPEEVINGFKNQRMAIYNRLQDEFKKKIMDYQKAQAKKQAQTEAQEKERIKQKNMNLYQALLLNAKR